MDIIGKKIGRWNVLELDIERTENETNDLRKDWVWGKQATWREFH